jgi:hypothetical protein
MAANLHHFVYKSLAVAPLALFALQSLQKGFCNGFRYGLAHLPGQFPCESIRFWVFNAESHFYTFPEYFLLFYH